MSSWGLYVFPGRFRPATKIRHGEAVGIIGPSGTGKSTILKIMAGLLAPDKGEVYMCGKKRHGLISDEEISGLRIGLVFQSAALFDSLTVRENVGFMLAFVTGRYEHSSMPKDKIAELVTESLAAVGLKPMPPVDSHAPSFKPNASGTYKWPLNCPIQCNSWSHNCCFPSQCHYGLQVLSFKAHAARTYRHVTRQTRGRGWPPYSHTCLGLMCARNSYEKVVWPVGR
eukprot:Gb_37241 [translate_table: standard]